MSVPAISPQPVSPGPRHALHSLEATRRMEAAALAATPPFTLMHHAGSAAARLARALAPHARTVWIACGAGNNGGDGLEAAALLRHNDAQVCVTWLGDEQRASADTLTALAHARAAGVVFCDVPPPLQPGDICLDALLGIGFVPRPGEPDVRQQRLRALVAALYQSPATLLAVDTPSGLNADTGQWHFRDIGTHTTQRRHTLSLLTLKPGLFTADGRDACGQAWLDRIGVDTGAEPPQAWLAAAPRHAPLPHASHKGSRGDVCVIGGEGLQQHGCGMTGAAVLAATAALYGGAGRVYLSLLDGGATTLHAPLPELMLRRFDTLNLAQAAVVCGCGGGQAIRGVLPRVLEAAAQLVLDADALNAVAADAHLAQALRQRSQRSQRPGATILTPHPLEAARLLGSASAGVQADRIAAACALAHDFACTVLLKGSGTIIAHPGEVPVLNPTGNARLATAGTGDVLAGMIGARLARGQGALQAACDAAFAHGQAADLWPEDAAPLVAHRLANNTP